MLHATPTKSAERGQRLQGLERECDMGARVERESSPEQQRQGLEMETCKMKHETRSGKRQENAQRLHIHVGISHSFSLSRQIFAILGWTRWRLAQGAWDPGACLPANKRREPGSREYLGLSLFGVEAVYLLYSFKRPLFFRLVEATETR
ncbi:hypothetical protein FPSE_10324 [Fusarium pseudograminearum CS3096]|uniref:Uncharacterized protein n=1 Tax=Fusarium pseudograminearum (strain CS3096) TaxID=1028729 RepID=K3V8A4_FUSPC|nr:hypothetical protein FPSE_10324 [Fusarium pseudograminearum CS3096]EKJ69499.1 hypothetical protein FPSE_10324 [Fusarium pseudograminearum CS3096]